MSVANTTEVRFTGTLNLEAVREPANAARLLPLFEAMVAQTVDGSPERATAEAFEAAALAGLGRRDESRARIEAILAEGHEEVGVYETTWIGAGILNDPSTSSSLIQAAARQVPSSDREALRSLFDAEAVFSLFDRLAFRGDTATMANLYRSLVAVEWPSPADEARRDELRLRLIDAQLAGGDRIGASEVANELIGVGHLLQLVTLRRYDGLIAPGEPSRAALRRAMAEQDRTTAHMLAAAPVDGAALRVRATYLLSFGRAEEVVEILEAHARDVPGTVRSMTEGAELVEQAAYALLMLGRGAEGEALFRQLVALPIRERPALLNSSINFSSFLWQAGRLEAALAHARKVDIDLDGLMNDFGRAWNRSAMACALAGLGQESEARRIVQGMRSIAAAGETALSRAYLCLGDVASAERLMISRLASEEPALAVLALQDWQVPEVRDGPSLEVERRMADLRSRPAVASALERVGQSLQLPMARSFWGAF